MAQKPDARLIGVDLLRAVSIILVIMLHWRLSGIMAPVSSALDKIADVFAARGTYGVTIFFVISGFLITKTTMHRAPDLVHISVKHFYIRRAARIQPLVLATISIGAAMLYFSDSEHSTVQVFRSGHHGPFDWVFWASLFSFTFNWVRIFHGGGVNHNWGLHWDVMWSLAVEEQFYRIPAVKAALSGEAWC